RQMCIRDRLNSGGLESVFYCYAPACIACSRPVYVVMKDTQKHSKITAD
ncbi:hypothetical protein ACV334_34205, partial [Pseudomonas aeruginosa]